MPLCVKRQLQAKQCEGVSFAAYLNLAVMNLVGRCLSCCCVPPNIGSEIGSVGVRLAGWEHEMAGWGEELQGGRYDIVRHLRDMYIFSL